MPAIPGLAALPFLTNETVFALDALPERLVVLGAGPVGCELAQAFRRLGAQVALVDAGRCLAASDLDAAAIVVERLRAEGVEVTEQADVVAAEPCAAGLRLRLADGAAVEGSHLLLAAGREARTDGMGLTEAGVAIGRDGILVDRHGRTSVRSTYAIGDCRAGPRFTHAAGHEGERLVMALGFGIPAPIDHVALPRVAYTDPELAEAGLTEKAARAAGGRVEVLRQDFADNDRAVCEGDAAGFCRIVRRGGRVVGVTIVGAGAGELLAPFLPLIARRRATLWAMAGTVLPYPTRGETPKATAFSAFELRVFSVQARAAARMVARLRAAMC